MVGRLYGGTDRPRDKYYSITPTNLEMAVLAQNASDQFTDPALMPLNSEDAMERYQLQIMKTSTPETRIPGDVDKTLSNRKRARELINLIDRGGPRGSNDLAYKPEIVQSNKSTYTYEVPSTDPVVASRDRNGTYHSSSSGNTVYRMTLPNAQTNAELGNKLFNFHNNRAKYAAAINRVENTSQIVDFIPEHKDPLWISRALDVTRNRLMPKVEIYTDNGDNTNREKNRCRDRERVAYKYRHKEYDVNRELHEVLDGGNRIKPEIGPRESDGTPIGDLVAALAKKGLGYAYEEADIENISGKIDGRKHANPNVKSRSKLSSGLDHTESVDFETDGKINDFRYRPDKVATVVDNTFEGLDVVMKEIIMGDVLNEIKRSGKRKHIKKPKTAKSVNKNFDVNGHNIDDDEKNERQYLRGKDDNHYNDAEREVMNYQIPVIMSNFKKDIIFAQSNAKVGKANKSGQKRGYTINDNAVATNVDIDNDAPNRAIAESLIEKSSDVGQGVRNLITELVPEIETLRGNDKINPNRRIAHGEGGKIVKFAVNNSEIFDKPEGMDSIGRGTRVNDVKRTYKKRPILPSGIKIREQTDRDGFTKKMNKKRGKVSSMRDDGSFTTLNR